MPKVKAILGGFVLAVGITGIVVAYLLVSANTVKKDVSALKGWEPPKGTVLESIKKPRKFGPVYTVVKHKDKAVPYLIESLNTWTAAEAKGVMITLALLGAKEGIAPLIGILKKDEGEGGYAAAASLGRYRDKAAQALKGLESGMGEWSPAIRTHVYQAMAWSRSKSLLELLAGGLKDPDEDVALTVGRFLSIRKAEVLVPAFLETLASDSADRSRIAAAGLVHNKSHVKVKDLEKPLKSSMAHVRANALEVLGHMDRFRALKLARPALKDPSPLVVVAAAEALHEMGDKVKSDKLLPLLESTDPDVVSRAAGILKKIGEAGAKEKYTALLAHSQVHTKKAAAILLRLCAKSQPGLLIDEPCIPLLIEMLMEPTLAGTAANTLRLWTRELALEDSHSEWKEWWDLTQEREKRLKEARAVYKTVKAWINNDKIHEEGKAREAVDLIDKAIGLYEEIDRKQLSRRGYENEIQKLIILKRQASTLLMDED